MGEEKNMLWTKSRRQCRVKKLIQGYKNVGTKNW